MWRLEEEGLSILEFEFSFFFFFKSGESGPGHLSVKLSIQSFSNSALLVIKFFTLSG